MARPTLTRAFWWLAVTLVLTARPSEARRLNCAAVRSALARGRSPTEVAIQFRTSTRRVMDCERGKDRHTRRLLNRRRLTPTAIPERTDIPTPEPTPEPPKRLPPE